MAREVAIAQGSYEQNPHRENKDQPLADGCVPEMPDYLDQHGREMWQKLVENLQSMNVMSSEYGELMTSYCMAYSGWRRCLEIFNQVGPVIVQRVDGQVRMKNNPAMSQLHRFRQQMDRLLPEFGLTPSSRTRLKSLKSGGEEDPFMLLIQRLTENRGGVDDSAIPGMLAGVPGSDVVIEDV